MPPPRRRYAIASCILFALIAIFSLLLDHGCVVGVSGSSFDPYRVLGVSRSASATDVRRAYKQMAKKYHPDKNSEPDAQMRFTQISESYEILSDPKKKSDFDTHGTVRSKAQREQEEARAAYYAQQRAQQGQHANYGYHYGFGVDPAFLRRQDAYHRETDDLASASVRLTANNYDHMISSITTQRHTSQGWLIYIFSHTCEPCAALNPSFAFVSRSLTEQFGGLVMTGKINSEFESGLVRKLGIRSVPTIISMRIAQNGEVTRHVMSLTRDSRGATQPPTVNQMRDFVGSTIFPIHKDGLKPPPNWGVSPSSSSSSIAPLFDLTAGLGAFKSTHDAAEKLKLRIRQFQTEYGTYPSATDATSPYVHVYVVSQHAHPSLLVRWLAHRFESKLRFGHISLPLLSHSSTLLTALRSTFVGIDLPHSVLEGSFVLIQRETNLIDSSSVAFEVLTLDQRWEEDVLSVTDASAQLQPYLELNVPKFHIDNFHQLCYPKFDRKSSAERAHSPQAHRECMILFAESQVHAHKLLLDLFRPSASSSSDSVASLPRHIQIGWLNPNVQSKFVNFFHASMTRARQIGRIPQNQNIQQKIEAVIIRATTSTFTIFPGTIASATTDDIRQWILHVNSNAAGGGTNGGSNGRIRSVGGVALGPVSWIDGKLIGGMPFLAEESSSTGVIRSVLHALAMPFKWMREISAGGNTTPAAAAGEAASSSAIILIFVFTVVFLLSTTSMLRFVSA